MNSFKHYLLVIAISLLPFVSIFLTSLAPHTHDSPVHFARMAAYYKALTEGQILPRWAGDLNYGYGMPLFNFIYHIPYLVTSVPIALGGGLVLSFKIALLVSFVLSGLFMYMFSLAFFKHEGKALVTTVLYQFAPFHLVDLVVRGDVAEGFALAFFPLVLFAITRSFVQNDRRKNVTFIGAAATLLILSHNSMSLVFFGISALFALWFAPSARKRLEACLGLTLGLLLSAFYWMPALFERKYTYGDLFMKDMYKSHFAPLYQFLLPNFTNHPSLQTGGVSVSFGLIQTAALISTIVLFIPRARYGKHEWLPLLFALVLTGASLFVMQPASAMLWSGIPILRMFQFPWRLLNVTTFALALLGGISLVRKNTPFVLMIAMSATAIASASVYFRPPLGFDPIDEAYYWNYPLNTTFFGETDIIWSAGPAGAYPEKRFQVIGGEGTIRDEVKKGTLHSFTVRADSPVHVVDRTQYFPGWRVYADGEKIPIEFQDQNWRGLITFRLQPGTHNVRVVWEASKPRQIAEWITVVTAIGTLAFIILPGHKRT